VVKSITNIQKAIAQASKAKSKKKKEKISRQDALLQLTDVENRMKSAADNMDFETAIALRAEWMQLKKDFDI